MAKILLCWELGGGYGHARRLAGLAADLSARGHKVAVATTMPERMRAMGLNEAALITIPQWPGVLAAQGQKATASTFGDLLAGLLFQAPDGISERLSLWERVFSESGAGLAVADYAPGAVLAARGRLPVVTMGDSYYLPPAHLPAFPRLFSTPPSFDEASVTQRINGVLAASGRPLLASYPDVGAATACFVTNFPVIDVYAAQRREPAIGPLEPMPEISTGEGRELFGYLPQGSEFNARIINGLLAARLVGRVVIPGLQRPPVPFVMGAALQFTGKLADLQKAFAGCGVYVSHGGAQSVAAALCAGVPQVVIAADDEKRLTGKCLAEAGAGISLRAEKLQSAELAEAIKEACGKPSYRRAALALARECQAIIQKGPKARLLSALGDLLAGK